MTFPGDPPALTSQREDTGEWVPHQTSPTAGRMTWLPRDETDPGAVPRLLDQTYPEGTWRTGPGCSMFWTPTPREDT